MNIHDHADQIPDRSVIAFIGCGLALVALAGGYIAWAVWTVPTDDAALRTSLAAVNKPALTTAVALHPDYCSIKGAPGAGWNVECIGVPLHHYTDVTICRPVAPEICAPAPPSRTDCVSFYWHIDRWGRPSNPHGTGGDFASIEDPCDEKVTYAADRE